MRRAYTVDLSPTSYSVAVDLVEITPADDRPVDIIGFRLYQTSDVGDGAEEVVGVAWVRGNTTSGSGGSSYTPDPKDPRDAAAGFTAEIGNTTPASTGTPRVLYSSGWNVRSPMEITFSPEQYIRCDQGNTMIVFRLLNAPSDPLTIGFSVDVVEA